MTYEKHVELVYKYNEQAPEIRKFKDNLVIPDGQLECPDCEGFGKEKGFSCLTPVIITCRACKGKGHVDSLYPYRKERGKVLWNIRKIHGITLRNTSRIFDMPLHHLSDIENGYIENIDYDQMEIYYKEKLEKHV